MSNPEDAAPEKFFELLERLHQARREIPDRFNTLEAARQIHEINQFIDAVQRAADEERRAQGISGIIG